MYLHETKLAMLIDADAVPVAYRRPYRDIDIRYPWRSDEQRAAEDRCEVVDAIVFDERIDPAVEIMRDLMDNYARALEGAVVFEPIEMPGIVRWRLEADRLAELALQRAHIDAAERATRPVEVIVEGPSSPPDFHINAELLRVAEDGFSSQQAKLAAERLARIAESRRKDGRFSALNVGHGEFREC